MEVKVERVKPPPPLQLNTGSSDPLGDESTLSDLATDASSEPIVIDPDSDSAGNLNSSDVSSSTSSSMATHSSSNPPPPGAADSIEVEENPIGSGDEQQMHRSEDDTVQNESAQETNTAEGTESSQQQSEPPSTTTTDVDASMSMPAFDDVISEKPTVTDHTEPMTAQDMPDVGAALGALGDASAAPDLSTEGITPMETDISAADNGAAQ